MEKCKFSEGCFEFLAEKSYEDLQAILKTNPLRCRLACICCYRSIINYFKAIALKRGVDVTDNLLLGDNLQRLARHVHFPETEERSDDITYLSMWYPEPKYLMDADFMFTEPTPEDVQRMVDFVERVRKWTYFESHMSKRYSSARSGSLSKMSLGD